ncbi:MAG: hypothetical protein AB7Q37_11720 [Pyrinomonadaceae bacterium]
MKWLSETAAIAKLTSIRRRFRERLAGYEARAKSCAACTSPGACCTDAHFVNVRISRLEAAAILRSINELEPVLKNDVMERTVRTVTEYGLDEIDAGGPGTYSCPLFEPGRGCLVHHTAKPLSCIAHACYEQREDLPPEHLLTEAESEVDSLNRRVYRDDAIPNPLPLALTERTR